MDCDVIRDCTSLCHASEYQEGSFVADFIARPNLFHFQDSKTAFLELLGKAER